MPVIRIEIDRGEGWRVRAEGDADATREAVLDELRRYAIQYPHRAFYDGELIGEIDPKQAPPARSGGAA